jgi:hypothetical protein
MRSVGYRAQAAAEESFTLSSRYAWMFWEMRWQAESWPVQGHGPSRNHASQVSWLVLFPRMFNR